MYVLKGVPMDLANVVKLKLNIDDDTGLAFYETAYQYMLACNDVSQYVFDHDFELNSVTLSKILYKHIRETFGLKSQMVQSAIRTVTARYKAVETQLSKKPYKIKSADKQLRFTRTLDWLMKPIRFNRPQVDLVRNRDYSFIKDSDGNEVLSINTLGNRIKVSFEKPAYFDKFLNGGFKFGTAKLVQMKGIWYLHISATKDVTEIDREGVKCVVGIDRGLRFLETTYDSNGRTAFVDGRRILAKRHKFDVVRAELQSKGTKSAKRALKRISGRENRWMSDVNHQLSKALVNKYGEGTLFVLEDLEDVSTDERNLHSKGQSHDLRNWAFYDLENKLGYKALASGCKVLKVDADYTSQRCPHCGRILKANRNHKTHTYTCDKCGFTTNDDRIGAMNIWLLGTLWVTGDDNPSFKVKTAKA